MNEKVFQAVAIRVEEDGGLIVLINGEEKKVYSGEVSLSVRTEK
jgi:biotin-(acetyl-CoA carboxylase) ligase